MRLVLRLDDRVNPHDDLVLRAGGGDVDALTRSAIENARDYEHLVAAGHIRSTFTISANIPREGVEPGPLDLCHFDIVVDAADGTELRAGIAEVRTLFTKEPNPIRSGTLDAGGPDA